MWSYFSGCRFAHGWYSRRGDKIEVLHSSRNIQASRNRSREEVNNQASRNRVREETHRNPTHANAKTKRYNNWEVDELSTADRVVTSANSSQRTAQLYTFWRQRGRDQDDHQRQKSDNETRVANPQSRAGWFSVRINLDPEIQIKRVDSENPTRRPVDERLFHPWWVESSPPFVPHHVSFDAVFSVVSIQLIMSKRSMWRNRSQWVWYQGTWIDLPWWSRVDWGMQSWNSDPSSIEKSMASVQTRLPETRLTHHNYEVFNRAHHE